VAAGLLEQLPHPASGRQRLIRRTTQGEHTHHQAERILQRLEEQLASRIGGQAADALRTVLETPWGPPPTLPSTGRARQSPHQR
ncbi:hypothetical protein ACWGIP_06860, partial [Streptomyces sp. NPDC054838]